MNLILSPSNYFFNLHAIPFFISGVLIMAEAVFVFWQNKRSLLNISFAGIALFCGIWLTGIGFIYSSANEPAAYIWSRYYDWFGIIFITPFVYLFSTVYNDEVSGRQRKFAYVNFVIASAIYAYCVLTPHFISGVWPYAWGYYPRGGVAELIFIVWFYTLMSLSFWNFVRSYQRKKDIIQKKQIKLVIIAHIFGFIGSLDFFANFGYPIYPIGSGALFIYLSMIAYTIVRYRLMDIETVLHKTIMWIASFSIIAFPMFFIYRWTFPYMKESVAGQLIFGVMSFIVLTVYLRVIQPKIDHFFQRRKADLEEISNQFIGDLVHLEGIENLTRRLEETVMNALYPQWMDIFLYDEKKKDYSVVNRESVKSRVSSMEEGNEFLKWLKAHNQIVYREFIEIDPEYAAVKDVARNYFESTGAMVAIPLVLNERLLGIINLEKKANLNRYKAVDFQFLTTIKNQSAIAISNSLMYQNIEEQVKERTRELVEVQKQLIQAEKLATVGTLSGGVAHEINNPLTAILTNVQMLLMFAEDEDAKMDKESLQMIEEATQRCRTIVQKLMTYAKKPLESEEVSVTDLSEVLNKTISFIRYQLEQDGLEISVEAKKGLYSVQGNPNELEQVLTNLILNARDAMLVAKKSGGIHIKLSRSDRQINLKIKDKGMGMSKDIIAKIFDPFYTTKDVGKGLGLGLSICQSIMEKCGGKILVVSEPGKGSTFTIQLPEYSQDGKNGTQTSFSKENH